MKEVLLAGLLLLGGAWQAEPAYAAAPMQVANEPENLTQVMQDYVAYHTSGDELMDQTQIANKLSAYIKARAEHNNGKKLAIVYDIDETLLSNWPHMAKMQYPSTAQAFDAWAKLGKDQAIQPIYQTYLTAIKHGVSVFLITGRGETLRAATLNNLRAQGIDKYSKLYLQPVGKYPNAAAYKTALRKQISEQGYDIIASVGDQYSDICGGFNDQGF